MFEGEYIHQYDHRYATFDNGRVKRVQVEQKADTEYEVQTESYLDKGFVLNRIYKLFNTSNVNHLIVLRRQARSSDSFIGISCILPPEGVEGNLTSFYCHGDRPFESALFCANLNSFIGNFLIALRQAGPNLNKSVYEKLPLVCFSADLDEPTDFSRPALLRDWMGFRALRLLYTSRSLDGFARSCPYDGEPFPWDEEQRQKDRYELEAAFFYLYGLSPEQVEYVMEQFDVLKRREVSRYGAFVSKEKVMAEFGLLAGQRTNGEPPQRQRRTG